MTEKREATKSPIPIGSAATKGDGVAEASATQNLPVGGPSVGREENNRPGQPGALQDESSSHESAGGDSNHVPAGRAADTSSTTSVKRISIRLGIREWTLVGAGLLGLIVGLLIKRRN
jgi:hypothetical protein